MFTFGAYLLKNLGVAISTAITAQQYKAGTNGPVAVLRHSLTQDGSVTSTQIRGGLIRKSAAATVTTAVAATNYNKQNPVSPTGDASLGVSATGFTATVEGTDADNISTRGFNVLNGMEVVYTPEERPIIAQSGIVAQKLLTAFNSTWSAELAVIEMRGG